MKFSAETKLVYFETDRQGNKVTVTVSETEAIRRSKRGFKSTNKYIKEKLEYAHDVVALLDFIVIHWAEYQNNHKKRISELQQLEQSLPERLTKMKEY